jgi:hypothetical protein
VIRSALFLMLGLDASSADQDDADEDQDDAQPLGAF